ncbi:MAG: tetratricopeptide repeat protein [Coleofasciculaceae cyanobacterium]
MIVKNEQAALPRVLTSVKDVVEEMVILDTGSTDNTAGIAREYGARVYHYPWCDDFSLARNEALKYVQGKWVLVLDADEVLKSEIVPELKKAIKNESYLVINLTRQEVGASQSPYSLVSRLFRNHPQISFSRPYHALIDDSVAKLLEKEPNWQVISLTNVAIEHYGYQPGAIASRDKYAKAQTAMEKFLTNHPHDAYTCNKLGALYLATNQINKGIDLLERGLKASDGEATVLYELHYHLGNIYSKKQNLPLAMAHYQAAIEQVILPRLKLGSYNNLGNLLLLMGDLINAKSLYETSLKIDPSFAAGHNNLGMTLKALGQLEGAIASYQQAIELNPNYADAYQNLGVVLLKIGKLPESLSAFKRAITLHEALEPRRAKHLRQGLAEMGFSL